MATYTFEQLRDMTIAQLREIAQGLQHEALEGFSTMHKEQILPALCKAMDIHMHHAAVGAKKSNIKSAIRKLKAQRAEAIAAHDYDRLANIRRQVHGLTRRLRHMADQIA